MRAWPACVFLRLAIAPLLVAATCLGCGQTHDSPTADPTHAAPTAPTPTAAVPAAAHAPAAADSPRFAPGEGPRIKGTVALDPAFAAAATGHPLLLILRSQQGQGMPIAVQRIESPVYPVSFDLGAEHAPLQADDTPQILRTENKLLARVSVSGAVMAGPDDIECQPVIVKADQAPVALTLDRKHGP
jgi:hypothetical protein